jgi:organic hydroperoxide reductase OsmC/OhrA
MANARPGLLSQKPINPGLPRTRMPVELNVTAKYSDRELFEKLVEIADRGCIMMNTLRGNLDIKVRIAALV